MINNQIKKCTKIKLLHVISSLGCTICGTGDESNRPVSCIQSSFLIILNEYEIMQIFRIQNFISGSFKAKISSNEKLL